MTRFYYRDYWGFEPSRPREAKGGIKAQSKRGAIGESWWAKRWIGVLESFNIGARLDRGRAYARRGQVLDIAVDEGVVSATVQGSRPRPYKVTIKIKPLSPADWDRLALAFAGQAVYVAKLLAGEMPQDIESVFVQQNFSLFPSRLQDIETDCSCPDWANPCKHIAAVYYLLGEEFDRDPFLIFKLRGISREKLVTRLGGGRNAAIDQDSSTAEDDGLCEPAPLPREPLSLDPVSFWGEIRALQDVLGEVRTPPITAAVLKRLKGFPFWRGKTSLVESLEPLYSAASARGLDLVLIPPPSENER